MAERDKRGRFVKGHKRLSGAGRKKGTPNKATKAWKDFVTEMSRDGELQAALRERVLARPELMLRVAEHAHGKPRQSVDVDQDSVSKIVYRWAGEEDD